LTEYSIYYRSANGHAAIDHQDMSSDVIGSVGSQEYGGTGIVLGDGGSAPRSFIHKTLEYLGMLFKKLFIQWSGGHAGGYSVYVDILF